MHGPERFFQDLDALGIPYERRGTASGQTFAVFSGYEILSGRFQSRTIDLGLEAVVSYPQAVGSSIHVRSQPHLFDYSDSVASVRNIIQSPLGEDWRYWSHAFSWGVGQTLDDLFGQIKAVFHRA